ncbi:MAG TPA: hypothetical protein VF184_11365 [Phycisphaeraceae bacterium]
MIKRWRKRMIAVVVTLAMLAQQAAWAQSEALAARQYLDWLRGAIDAMEADLPAYTQAAQLALEPFLAGRELGVRGGAGLAVELGGRAGGFITCRSRPGEAGDLILYAFGVTTAEQPDAATLLEDELTDAQRLRDAGSVVIGIASIQQLEAHGQLERARRVCHVLLDNHAPAADGLMRSTQGKPIIPTFVTADAASAWVFCCELYAACTRAGRTPALYQSIMVPGARERNAALKGKRFQDDVTVEPIDAGVLGRAYLAHLRELVERIGRESWPALAQAAKRASQTLNEGGRVFVRAGGHYPVHHHGGQLPTDPGLFIRLDHDGSDPALPSPGENDFVIAVGYAFPPESDWWGDPAVLRQAGRGTAWALAAHDIDPAKFGPNEILIDQCWIVGDALVDVPGYDVRLAPPSAVTSELILWALTAQVYHETAGTITTATQP